MENKKIVFTAPGRVEVHSEPLPQMTEPGKKELTMRNKVSLISPGTELACLSGNEGWFPLPGTPGYIAVGEVVIPGDDVKGAEKGDVLFTYGPHQEIYRIDTEDRYQGLNLKVPKNLSPAMAVFTRMASIAMTAIRQSSIQLGDFVLVSGLGLVGNFAAQLAQLQGARVIAVEVNENRRKVTQKMGIGTCLDAGSDYKEQIRELTGNDGVTTYIDATGLSSVISDNLEMVAPRGEVILVGSPRASYKVDLTETFNHAHLRDVQIKGASEWLYPTFSSEFHKHSIIRNSQIIMDLLGSGKLKAEELITHRFKPESAAEAYDGLKHNPEEFIGVLFEWD